MKKLVKEISLALLGNTHLFFLGQAGFIIKSSSGQLLGVDMYLSNCVERLEGHIGFKRLIPSVLDADSLVFDYIIATHPHYDHYDVDSIPVLMSNTHTKLYVSANCKQFVERDVLCKNNVTYVKPGDDKKVGDFTLHFINCDHGTGAPDAVGVLIEVDNKCVLLIGDSCLRVDRVQEYLKVGKVDVMIAPINGEYGNLNEQECVTLAEFIRPNLTIPCHFGMFASHGGNPKKFHEIMASKGMPYLFMTPGEKYTIE